MNPIKLTRRKRETLKDRITTEKLITIDNGSKLNICSESFESTT